MILRRRGLDLERAAVWAMLALAGIGFAFGTVAGYLLGRGGW